MARAAPEDSAYGKPKLDLYYVGLKPSDRDVGLGGVS